jgi:hypothetical protein
VAGLKKLPGTVATGSREVEHVTAAAVTADTRNLNHVPLLDFEQRLV